MQPSSYDVLPLRSYAGRVRTFEELGVGRVFGYVECRDTRVDPSVERSRLPQELTGRTVLTFSRRRRISPRPVVFAWRWNVRCAAFLAIPNGYLRGVYPTSRYGPVDRD